MSRCVLMSRSASGIVAAEAKNDYVACVYSWRNAGERRANLSVKCEYVKMTAIQVQSWTRGEGSRLSWVGPGTCRTQETVWSCWFPGMSALELSEMGTRIN